MKTQNKRDYPIPENVTLASCAGFCFGVSRAVDSVTRLCREKQPGERVYTLDRLIHNDSMMRELEERGVEIASEEQLDEIFRTSGDYPRTTVAIRAHGIRGELYEKLARFAKESGGRFRVLDCTCPDVKKIHRAVGENSEGRATLIIGNREHPEVEGIMSFARGEVYVCSGSDELMSLYSEKPEIFQKPLLMAAQTTQKLTEWKICQNFIKKVCTNALIFDTICSVTESRQNEVGELSKKSDVMLIIGDASSSNTTKLYEIAKKNLARTYFIHTPEDIKGIGDISRLKVGISAGASTPGGIIEEVIKTMSQNENINSDAGAENFAEMLEQSLKTLNTGETVKGVITSVSQNEIHVDLGAKATGIIPSSELSDDPSVKAEDKYKVGDEIEAIVVKVSDLDGIATLSRKRIDNVISWRKIVDAFNTGAILEGKIVEVVKSGVIIALDGVRVFVPASQSGLPKDADLATLVGSTHRVHIIDLNEQRHRAVASIRAVEREERKAKETEFWASIEKGKKYEGVVKSLTSYGAFVDLGGVDGMVHSSELSWKRIKHPSEIVSIGDTVNVYVKDFDPETKRISLGYKTEETNPWNIFVGKYKVGDVAHVKIVSMMPFGAFAEVVPGTDGLIHISQIADRKIQQPSDVLTLGEEVDAKIIDIDTENHKISLSIRALLEKPDQDINADDEVVASTDNQ